MANFPHPPQLTKPAIFVTGTDTGIGKTVISCALAAALRQDGMRVGVCKPLASGCRREREGLVSDDAEALAHFADCRLPLDVIHPVRYAAPLAPAAAGELVGVAPDWDAVVESLERLDQASDVLVVEGVGGLMVPLDHTQPRLTVLDLILWLDMPVLVVARAGLGTLNHSAMTIELLRQRNAHVTGLVLNGYDADAASEDDISMQTNRRWIERLTGTSVLAVTPLAPADECSPEAGRLPGSVLDAVAAVDWLRFLRRPYAR